jgi:hypothetical protein
MTAVEIAETLHNGNISTAREALTRTHDGFALTATEAALKMLDTVEALAEALADYHDDETRYIVAIEKLRRCLEGSTR